MKSNLARVLSSSLTLVALAFAPGQEAAAQRRTITVTAAQLTQGMAARFPQRRCLLGLACVTLTDPQVRLEEGDDRLFLTTRAQPDVGPQALSLGTIEVAGKPRYDASRGAFFIDAPEILRLEFPELPKAYVAPATELSRGLLVDYLRQTPVWVLDEHDAQQALAKLVLREVQVRGGKLRLVIGDDE
jgi:hypothetical protein